MDKLNYLATMLSYINIEWLKSKKLRKKLRCYDTDKLVEMFLSNIEFIETRFKDKINEE